jgi:nitrite reductase/ring-hydroxylating ferredoxin subunit
MVKSNGDFVKVAETTDPWGVPNTPLAGNMKECPVDFDTLTNAPPLCHQPVDSKSICLAKVDGNYYAIGNICTHKCCHLAGGKLLGPATNPAGDGYEVWCPCHYSQFDVRTGTVIQGPATVAEPTYEVKVEGTDILVRKPTAIVNENKTRA